MQTTAPTDSAIGEYHSPVQPIATKIEQVRMRVAIVIPETGFDDDPKLPLPERVDAFEAWLCKDALERTRYKQKEAAALLGLTYDQFRQRYRKYALGKE